MDGRTAERTSERTKTSTGATPYFHSDSASVNDDDYDTTLLSLNVIELGT